MNKILTPELFRAFSRGDQKAFEDIYKNYAHLLFNFCKKQNILRQDAEDMVGEIMTSVCLSRRNLDTKSKFTSHVTQMLRRQLEIASGKKFADIMFLQETAIDETRDENNAEDSDLVSDERYRTISNAIHFLKGRRRDIMEMYFIKRMTISTIASKLGIKETTVRTQKLKALKRLRKNLSQHHFLNKNL